MYWTLFKDVFPACTCAASSKFLKWATENSLFSQCALLNEKLDSLVKALSEEAEAQVITHGDQHDTLTALSNITNTHIQLFQEVFFILLLFISDHLLVQFKEA